MPCRCRPASAAKLNFEEMARHLKLMGGEVSFNRFLLKFTREEHEFTVFPDGRAIIKGTSDLDKAGVVREVYWALEWRTEPRKWPVALGGTIDDCHTSKTAGQAKKGVRPGFSFYGSCSTRK